MDSKTRNEEIAELRAIAQDLQLRLEAFEQKLLKLSREGGYPPRPIMVAHVEDEKCLGCGICEKVCPARAIHMEKTANINLDMCRGCGWCVKECPRGAISLIPLSGRETANGSYRYEEAVNKINRRGHYGRSFVR